MHRDDVSSEEIMLKPAEVHVLQRIKENKKRKGSYMENYNGISQSTRVFENDSLDSWKR
jgi:hypothetical protein